MRVLIVEDDDLRRFETRRLLKRSGCRVIEAATGAQAMALLRAATVTHVVLLDYLLPEMHEYRLLHEIGSDPALVAQHVFVVMSSHPALVELPLPQLGGRWMRLLHRPFDIATFRSTVALASRRPALVGPSSTLAMGAPTSRGVEADVRSTVPAARRAR
jgi:CheY-like chemotaxis protein